MTSIEIPEIGYENFIPASFDEMSQDEFVWFAKLYLDFQNEIIDLSRLKTEMVFRFLEMKPRWQLELLPEDEKDKVYENVFRISEKIDFLFREEVRDGKIILKLNTPWTKNHVPEYKGHVGYEGILSDVTFMEYKNAHVAAIEFLNNGTEFDLDWFCATLYRKPKWSFPIVGAKGRRPKYDEFNTSKYIAYIQNWPLHVKYATLLDFLSFEEYIRTGTFTIDGKDISFDILFKNEDDDETESENEGAGLTGLLFTLAETRVFGNVKETSEQNLFDVLFRLWQVQTEAINLKAKQKK